MSADDELELLVLQVQPLSLEVKRLERERDNLIKMLDQAGQVRVSRDKLEEEVCRLGSVEAELEISEKVCAATRKQRDTLQRCLNQSEDEKQAQESELIRLRCVEEQSVKLSQAASKGSLCFLGTFKLFGC